MRIDLTGRAALVTGSTRGIGRGIAETLAGCGARVAVVGRDQARAAEAAAAIGRGAQGFAADVADSAQVAALVEQVESAFGAVDILVNNAGLTRDNLLLRIKDDDWDAVLDANLKGAFAAIRAATRGMMKRRWGRIVAITSVVGATGNPGQTNYAAAKAGTVGFSKALAAEVASRGITVNCVAPGFIATAMTDALTPEQKERIAGSVPLGRIGTPDEVAACVLFLSSDEARYVTGHTLHVNGGLAML